MNNKKNNNRNNQHAYRAAVLKDNGTLMPWGKAKMAKAAKDANATIVDAADTFRVKFTSGTYPGIRPQWDTITQ